MPRPPPAYTLEMAQQEKAELLTETVKSVAENEFLVAAAAGGLGVSKDVKDFADKCVKAITFVSFAAALYHFGCVFEFVVGCCSQRG